MYGEILHNYKPILLLEPSEIKPTTSDFVVKGVFNPAAVRLKNGKIVLFVRVAETPKHGKRYFVAPRMCGTATKPRIELEKIPRNQLELTDRMFVNKWGVWRLPTMSHLRKIVLEKDGLNIFQINQKPDFSGCVNDGDFGVEDPRITKLKKEKRFAMTYVSVSFMSGVSTSLAISRDLINWNRQGIIFPQQNKDVMIFPEKINGYYVALHRPEGTMIFDKPRIWISYSKNLEFWGREKPLLSPRAKGWDSLRIGAGAVPVKIKEGFLELYHGVSLSNKKNPDSKKIYSAGAILFSAKNPEKIVARTPTNKPLFLPTQKFEQNGFMDKVVFPTGAIKTKDKKYLLIYSGGADFVVTVRKIKIKDILNSMEYF